MRRPILLVTLALVLAVSAAPALAQGRPGDVPRGQVERGPEHANSICSFSGLNDEPDDPDEGGQVQSYGQIVRAGFKAFVPSPGEACNGHLNPLQEGNPEG